MRISRVVASLGILALAVVPAARAQYPQRREGFWIGFGLGYGSADISCDNCDSGPRTGGVTAFLKLGGTPSRNVLIGGVFAALGGAYLSMEATNSFQQGMTTGRGFIGLAAMIVGRWSPVGAFGAALLFSSSTALGNSIKFSPPSGDLGTILTSLPDQVYDALPYLVTIVILAGVVGRSIPPAADGQAYEREAAT